MAASRAGDRREGIYFRQGKAAFQLPGAGHEALAALVRHIRPGDYVFPHYRDRAIMLALGVPNRELALAFFAKAESSCGGRQLSSHFSDRARNVVSCGSPTGMQCLPAAGVAWALQLDGSSNLVVCSLGDATTREGEYYEAISFAIQLRLPIIFLVEDNGYGISTPTKKLNPYTLKSLSSEHCVNVDGRETSAVDRAFENAARKARSGRGPTVVWAEVDRLYSHTLSDDHRVYRTPEELALAEERDPIKALSRQLIEAGTLTREQCNSEISDAAHCIDKDYEDAFCAADPDPLTAFEHTFSARPLREFTPSLKPSSSATMLQAINETLGSMLDTDDRILLFGEDVEDPKGGVFGLTKGLSTRYPQRVFNSPLAEATIAGAAAGLAIAGFRPVVELQFIDFVGPAFNQIVNQIATLRWRTVGKWSCPLTIIAPCGAYLPSGGPWHSQTNEAWFAHAPGLQVVMPSTPTDAAAMLRASAYGDDPVLFLVPKHLLRIRQPVAGDDPLRIGEARVCVPGDEVTILAWGNTVELAIETARIASFQNISVEVIDLRSIVPCDWKTIHASVRRTGRLIVVQEDNRTCSFGQNIITELMGDAKTWDAMFAPPQHVSRGDVHVGFHVALEAAVLPSVIDILHAVKRVMEH
ncbi:alpha-ketoacid dehydrogenase subunit alpha/beta [Methylobacterium sp. Leaf87]|uniref:alpha-ketoacid dehydrogenase subunit alpha/beta n=1 Tax=Methylobacterium sp. Leaf87 TaxID=1736243 RepID=UPI0009EB5B49|nr:alpha-ketoacid dehydrogenase subunit alpha/beta [Methylobacterium sp. Leaf87]